MDTRILALLLLISVAGSSADLRSPPFRARRGLQEIDRHLVMDFAGVSRTKRQSGDVNTSKATAVPKSTSNANTATSPNGNPESIFTGKENPVTASAFNSNRPTTTSTSDPNSTTSDTFKSSPTTTIASTTVPMSEITISHPLNQSTTPRSKSTRSSSSTTLSTSASEAGTVPITENTSNSGELTSLTTTTVAPGIGSRIDAGEETQIPNEKIEPDSYANQGSNVANLMNPGFSNFAFPPYFVPNFLPDYSYPSSPYGDSTFNSVPSTGDNSAWVGPSNGGGIATSFASASASAGAPDNSNYDTSPLVNRGRVPDQSNTGVASTAAIKPNMPNMPIMPNMVNTGGYGYGGDTAYYPGPIVFPGYDFANFQREMEKLIRDFQLQSQQQQQALFGANNRIGVAGGSTAPGPHTAFSSINLGPGGGYQAGGISPAAPGLQSRFGEEIPPPSGNSFGVFSSSSSHSLVGPDGKTIAHKSSTTGVNDNGKITFRTVED